MEDNSKEEDEEFTKYYEQGELIDNGTFGNVYKGKDKSNNESRAIKIIKYEKIKSYILKESNENEDIANLLNVYINGYINEFKNMKICSENNNNSVKCWKYFKNNEKFVIIMEECDGNLEKLLLKKVVENKKENKNDKGFTPQEVLEIMKQLNNAFKIMKKNNIIHRDLKLENILIKYNDKEHKTFTVKLADYGCSKRLDSSSQKCKTFAGTVIYMAPEILEKKEYDDKCDLWSIGIIIYRLLFVKSPFSGKKEYALIQNFNKFDNNLLKQSGNDELDDLIKKLLVIDPEKRINWDNYFNHGFFRDNKKKDNTINLIYEIENEGVKNLFGEKFVSNNMDNIELIINGEQCDLIKQCNLKKGINNIKMIIKNKINNLEYMFYECNSLTNIDDLEYLDVKEINNFSHIFSGCKSLSNIKSLKNWDVSNGINFSNMFCGCKLLSDISPLKDWKISKAQNLSWMFRLCQSLSDIKSLENWDVSNVNNFTGIFSGCTKLSDIESLQNWNVSKGNDFSWVFSGCKSLSDIMPLQNWKLANGNNFSCIFNDCKILSNIKPLEKWDVSGGDDFSNMFNECIQLSDLSPIENWNVSNGKDFSYMFSFCKSLSDLKPLENWNVSNGYNFSYMFCGCDSLSNIEPLKNWNVLNGSNFLRMFSECTNLLDIKPLENWSISDSYFDDLLE